jgi:hypothetical protein
MKPKTPIDIMAYAIPRYPKTPFSVADDNVLLIIPNPGIIKIYTSGCPKNQNKC